MTGARERRQHTRWVEGTVKRARGETVEASHEAAMEAYEWEHPDVRDEESMWEGIGRLGESDPENPSMDDDAMLAAVMGRLDAGEGLHEGPAQSGVRPRRRAGLLALVGTVGLAAAAAIVLSWVGAGGLTLIEGRDGPRVGSKAEMSAQTERTSGQLEEAEPPVVPQRRVVVPEQTAPPPEAPPVVDVEPEAKPVSPRPTPRGPDAEAMLGEAQGQLASGETGAAIETYLRLLRKHPRSPQASTALISLGRLRLRQGRADLALEHYDRYLASGRTRLAEDARYGRIRALDALGRDREADAAAQAFMAHHPTSVHAPRLRRRLATER